MSIFEKLGLSRPRKTLLASAEADPYSKEGGLGQPACYCPVASRSQIALLIAPLNDESRLQRDLVSCCDWSLTIVHSAPGVWFQLYEPDLDCVMVDADYFETPHAFIDYCVEIRKAAPKLPIIMISSDVTGDDHSSERMVICDSTLQKPFGEARLRAAVSSAKENNIEYFRRHRALGVLELIQ